MSILRIFIFIFLLAGPCPSQESASFTINEVALMGTAAPASLAVSSVAPSTEKMDYLRMFAMIFGVSALTFTYGYALFYSPRRPVRR